MKGYEYEKGEYIVIDEEDFKQANPKKTSSIQIDCFANLNEIDLIYFAKPYYLEPDKKAVKAYQLLKEALLKSKKVAIARFVFRNKEHLGALLPFDNLILLIQMRYANEVRPNKGLEIPVNEKIEKKEMDSALKLIDQLTEPFNIKKYHDTFSEEISEIIAQKLKGKKPAKKAPTSTKPSKSLDLMKLLTESLKESISKSEEVKKPPRRKVISPLPKKRKSK